MILIIISVLLCVVLLDFSLIGFLPKVLKIWPPLKGIRTNILIEDTVFYSVRTNMMRKSGKPFITKRLNYKSILLTSRYLIIRNTFLTYLFLINTEFVNSYSFKKGIILDELILHLTIDDKNKFIKFKTKKFDAWINSLIKIGMKESVGKTMDG